MVLTNQLLSNQFNRLVDEAITAEPEIELFDDELEHELSLANEILANYSYTEMPSDMRNQLPDLVKLHAMRVELDTMLAKYQ